MLCLAICSTSSVCCLQTFMAFSLSCLTWPTTHFLGETYVGIFSSPYCHHSCLRSISPVLHLPLKLLIASILAPLASLVPFSKLSRLLTDNPCCCIASWPVHKLANDFTTGLFIAFPDPSIGCFCRSYALNSRVNVWPFWLSSKALIAFRRVGKALPFSQLQ